MMKKILMEVLVKKMKYKNITNKKNNQKEHLDGCVVQGDEVCEDVDVSRQEDEEEENLGPERKIQSFILPFSYITCDM